VTGPDGAPAPPPVFAALVGQDQAVAELSAAAAAAADLVGGRQVGQGAMTHAWLFTGPPGSGRSVAARAFAAALQCPAGGCGTCADCHTTLAGTHADVTRVVPEGLSIGVEAARQLVRQASGAPVGRRWRVVLVEDADRLTESAANALLKAVEEPPARGVFLLCTPTTHPDDVPVTIRSRCRSIVLGAPPPAAVAQLLRRDGVDAPLAAWAAQVAQGHVGRARRLATDEQARGRRWAVLQIPGSLRSLDACYAAAEALVAAAEEEAAALTGELDERESEQLKVALGAGGTGRRAATATRGSAAAVKDLERQQRSRRTRAQRDALDRALTDLAGFYRDVLVIRLGSQVPPVHPDLAEVLARAARAWPAAAVLRRLEAVLACRAAIEANVKPLIAAEAMAVSLREG